MSDPARESWGVEVFDRIHARGPDPWEVETSAYEREKYAQTLAALPRAQYGRGLEIGCSIGAQTVLLAARCAALLALDVAAEPVRRTRARCAGLTHVEVRQACLPRDWPAGSFDLIVLSEVLYFFSPGDVASAARLALGSLRPDGAIVLVNWTGFTDTPTTGNEAADAFVAGAADLRHAGTSYNKYRIDVLVKGSGAFRPPDSQEWLGPGTAPPA